MMPWLQTTTRSDQVTAPCTAVIAEARSFSSSWWLSWLELWWFHRIGLRKSQRPSGWAAAWRCCHTPRSTCSRWSWDSPGNTPVSQVFFGRSWMNLQDVSKELRNKERTVHKGKIPQIKWLDVFLSTSQYVYILYYIILYYIILYYIILYIILCYIILYYIKLYYLILYYSILYMYI